MPAEIMLLIFLKLGVVDVLVNVQNVCSYWRKLAKDPILFRSLDFQGAENFKLDQLKRLAKEAVDRSQGQLLKFSSTEHLGWEEILLYVNYTKNSPKSLHLREKTTISAIGLAEVFRGLHSVEELDMWCITFDDIVIEQVGRTCQKLTTFRFHIDCGWAVCSDQEVSTMVKNLPQLRRLSLAEFVLTNRGVQTILDGCPLLEHLDLQYCLCDNVEKGLWERCAVKIKTVIPGMSKKEFKDFFEEFRDLCGQE